MEIRRQLIQGEGFKIPSIAIIPKDAKGSAVIVHGYGGCKEEQLGLAWRVAEIGIAAYAIDLRGHGENDFMFDDKVVLDVAAAISHCSKSGKVAAIGHSLGARLLLLSDADFVIGISPAFNKTFSNKTQETINALRGYRVRDAYVGVLFQMLDKLPEWQPDVSGKVKIIFGSRDVPEVISKSNELKEKGVSVVQIDKALHSDVFLLEETFESIIKQLKEWFSI